MARGTPAATETERVRSIQDKTAPRYDRQISFFERILFGGGREWVCSQATGDVMELAAGTGRNLAHYQPDVRLTTIELSPEMLAIAKQRARELESDADLREGDAEALEFPDESFDSVVITLGLCTIPDDRQAVREAHRVLRPGGRLLLLEHVRSPSLPVRIGQRLLDPLAVRFQADHLVRDPHRHRGLDRAQRAPRRSALARGAARPQLDRPRLRAPTRRLRGEGSGRRVHDRLPLGPGGA